KTLGFRGEALPSIASVSRFRLTTREEGAVEGTEITVEGGKVRDVRDAGCPPGTAVEVRDLFYNVPARRKFLRSEATEAAHIDHQVRLHALASPEARVVFRKEGRTAFDMAATGDRRVRISDLCGREILPKLREIGPVEHPGMAASGYLLPVEEARKSRRGQYLFLNGRPVEDRVVWRALEEGYRGALPAGRHPVAWLWLEIDPLLVDVNVHPAKREVRFHRPAELRALVLEAVEGALRPGGMGPEPGARRPDGQPSMAEGLGAGVKLPAPGGPGTGSPRPDLGGSRPHQRSRQGGLLQGGEVATRERPEGEREAAPRSWEAEAQPELDEVAEPAAPTLRVVGVLEGRYVVLEAGDGLVLMEGEAARERILYERFLAGAEHGTPESQGLLVPVLLELEARDADVVLRNADNFREAGMEVESFGGVTVQLRSLPALLTDANPRTLLLDLVDEMVASVESRAGRSLTFEKFAGELARVGARGERCRVESAQALLEALFACELPYCTPDGRPTLVQFSSTELARKFGR
ncbi:MAG: hypothetical protein GWO24_03530, partial [Akkermansiaceae bacterium]|nr:hypothetical protein [Akkermansiaceae bacterium]